jgi:hypothetical protein
LLAPITLLALALKIVTMAWKGNRRQCLLVWLCVSRNSL